MITENLSTFQIHKLTQAQYDRELAAGRINEKALYLTPDEGITTDILTDLGITATVSELNKLDGVTATTQELNYTDGVTSNIQTQLNGKAASSHNHAASNITSGTLNSNRLPTVPITKGGTGATTADNARTNLNAMSATNPVGTGSFSIGRLTDSTVGTGSCAIGLQNTASGNYSIALSYNNTASGGQSFAVGNSNTASGDYSLAAGTTNKADSYGSCALGQLNHAKGEAGIAAGRYCLANGLFSVALGNKNRALANYSFSVGSENTSGVANGTDENGLNTSSVPTSGVYSVSIGRLNTASGESSVAIGTNNTASGVGSVALGYNHTASGSNSTALGYLNTANGSCSLAVGCNSTALNYQMTFGHFNNQTTATDGVASGTSNGTAFVIGNGTNVDASNAFRIDYNGKPYAKSSFTTTGCDYAEYFEWQDLNPNSEDRRGYFVTLDEDKIKIAEPNDYILGIISGQPSVIGNGDEDWMGRYVFDEFGAFVYEDFEYEEEVPETVVDEETGKSSIVTKKIKKIGKKYKENPDYDSSLEYIQRENRPEWDAVGMLGVLSVRDDGTCQVNGYCKVAEGGMATASETGYRVIKRVNDNIVKVVFR